MGEVIRFPDAAGTARSRRLADADEPATVIILPVVRIVRDPEDAEGQPQSGNTGRRRRRRAAR